jgi:hypothetical protein
VTGDSLSCDPGLMTLGQSKTSLSFLPQQRMLDRMYVSHSFPPSLLLTFEHLKNFIIMSSSTAGAVHECVEGRPMLYKEPCRPEASYSKYLITHIKRCATLLTSVLRSQPSCRRASLPPFRERISSALAPRRSSERSNLRSGLEKCAPTAARATSVKAV